jgi:6-pyruvoyltetrahydropterin/6-carboxytetrahydropterin synthase
MSKIRITKEFNFEMAHALDNYDGKCANIHGHSYKLFVTLLGIPISDRTNPKNGMVLDFSDLKTIVKQEITDIFDHGLVLYKDSKYLKNIEPSAYKIIVSNYNPTCENLLIDFSERIKNLLPKEVELYSLKLVETATSYAEWFKSDND